MEDGNSSQVDSFTSNSSGFPATNSVSKNKLSVIQQSPNEVLKYWNSNIEPQLPNIDLLEPKVSKKSEYYITMPKNSEYYITMPRNVVPYNNALANFLYNGYSGIMSDYRNIKQEYFSPRNYQNRYRQKCIPSDILYNIITNYQISPNPKLVENGGVMSNYIMKKILSKIPIAGKYINNIALGEKIGNSITDFYNALAEAGCIK